MSQDQQNITKRTQKHEELINKVRSSDLKMMLLDEYPDSEDAAWIAVLVEKMLEKLIRDTNNNITLVRTELALMNNNVQWMMEQFHDPGGRIVQLQDDVAELKGDVRKLFNHFKIS